MKLQREHFQMIYGAVLMLVSIVFIGAEYHSIFKALPNELYGESYVIYSKLLFMSKWLIIGFLFFVGVCILFKSKDTNVLLLIFSISALLEIYINEKYYIVKTMEGLTLYVLAIISLVSMMIIVTNAFKVKGINFIGLSSSIAIAVITVYLPNALITMIF